MAGMGVITMATSNRPRYAAGKHLDMATKTDAHAHDVPKWLAIILTAVGLSLMIAGALSSSGCGGARRAGTAIVDCTIASAPAIGELVDEFKVLLTGERPNWDAVKARAIAAGVAIGGCALAIVVAGQEDEPVARRSSALIDPRYEGRAVLEEYRRAYAGGASFKLPSGEIR